MIFKVIVKDRAVSEYTPDQIADFIKEAMEFTPRGGDPDEQLFDLGSDADNITVEVGYE